MRLNFTMTTNRYRAIELDADETAERGFRFARIIDAVVEGLYNLIRASTPPFTGMVFA